jgi:hypothetical protein
MYVKPNTRGVLFLTVSLMSQVVSWGTIAYIDNQCQYKQTKLSKLWGKSALMNARQWMCLLYIAIIDSHN